MSAAQKAQEAIIQIVMKPLLARTIAVAAHVFIADVVEQAKLCPPADYG